jgi:hypothetical protein
MIPEIKDNYKVHKILEVLITELVMRKVLDESTAKNIIETGTRSITDIMDTSKHNTDRVD